MTITPQQLQLIRGASNGALPLPIINQQAIKGSSTIVSALIRYRAYLQFTSRSEHTTNSFLYDIGRLARFLGWRRKLSEVTTSDLRAWLEYVATGSGAPAARKTLSRKISAVKNFFRWLHSEGVIVSDPSEDIPYQRAVAPLPEILTESECQRLLAAGATDSRAEVLVRLALHAGLKREELKQVRVTDVDISNPYRPEVIVRHERRNQMKDRRLALLEEFGSAFKRFVEEYMVTDYLFPYSDRNLNLILETVEARAWVRRGVTIQMLRDTFAARLLRAGVEPDRVRRKLGLSESTWRESGERYGRLAFPV